MCIVRFEQLILTCALVLWIHALLLALKTKYRRYDRTRLGVYGRPGLAHPVISHRTASAPPRRVGYTPLNFPIRPPNAIPMLRPEFFQSDFWHQFHAQSKPGPILSHIVQPTCTATLCLGPLLEPKVFLSRLEKSLDGIGDSLGVPGRLVAMCLVAWAASFGHNEEGRSDQPSDPKDWVPSAKSRTNNMVKEVLYLIDSYGIIRKPTWDGVVALLTILPLTKGNVTPGRGSGPH